MVMADSAIAGAQPDADGQCPSLTMTNGQNVPNPSVYTRAGQIGAATGAGPSVGSMPINCQPASHN